MTPLSTCTKRLANKWFTGSKPERNLRKRFKVRPVRLMVEQLEDRLAPAILTNPSFEAGLTGWTTIPGAFPGSVTTVASAGPLTPTDGSSFAKIQLNDVFISPVGTTGYGPAIRSSTATFIAGETVSVDWSAGPVGDVADVRSRLFTSSDTYVGTLFDTRFGFLTNWITSSVLVPSTGSYYVEFQVGSYDSTFGGLIGAILYVDNIVVDPTNVYLSGGNLQIDNGLADNALALSVNGDNLVINNSSRPITAGAGLTRINANTVSVPLSSITGQITVNGNDGNDTLTIDYAGGSFNKPIIFNGGLGFDAMSINGAGNVASIIYTPDPATAGNGLFDVDGSTVSFTGLEPIDVTNPGGSFSLAPSAPLGADNVISIDNGFNLTNSFACAPYVILAASRLRTGGRIRLLEYKR